MRNLEQARRAALRGSWRLRQNGMETARATSVITIRITGTNSITHIGTIGTSLMRNHTAKPNQTKTPLPAGHLPAPMEVEDRPCEVILAGSCLCLRASR